MKSICSTKYSAKISRLLYISKQNVTYCYIFSVTFCYNFVKGDRIDRIKKDTKRQKAESAKGCHGPKYLTRSSFLLWKRKERAIPWYARKNVWIFRRIHTLSDYRWGIKKKIKQKAPNPFYRIGSFYLQFIVFTLNLQSYLQIQLDFQ